MSYDSDSRMLFCLSGLGRLPGTAIKKIELIFIRTSVVPRLLLFRNSNASVPNVTTLCCVHCMPFRSKKWAVETSR